MKTTWIQMKGVCLLLLGMAMTLGGRILAADINTLSFATLADNSVSTTAGTADASPFKDESAATAPKVVSPDSGVLMAPPSPPAAAVYGGSRSASCPVCENGSCPAPCASGNACCCDDFIGAPGKYWFRGEYLHWWTSGAYLPPMVSNVVTGQTLFGGDNIREGDHDGYRMNFGMWLDCQHRWGVEADYFDVTGRPDNYDSGEVNGNMNGTAFPIGRLLNDTSVTTPPLGPTPNAIDGVGYLGLAYGRITVETSDYFQSAGIWLRRELRASEWSTSGQDVNWLDPCARSFRVDGLCGYRFARLLDAVNEQDNSIDINAGLVNGVVTNPDYLNSYTSVNDYRASNTFNGAEVGFDAVYTVGRWSLEVVDKIALGFNQQSASAYNQVTIDYSNNIGGIPTAPVPQNTSPLQEFSRSRISAIPEVTLTAGCQVTDHFKVTVGYDLLYWTGVIRAAEQIPVYAANGYPFGTPTGAGFPLPGPTGNETHFLGQGLRLGAECRF